MKQLLCQIQRLVIVAIGIKELKLTTFYWERNTRTNTYLLRDLLTDRTLLDALPSTVVKVVPDTDRTNPVCDAVFVLIRKMSPGWGVLTKRA